VFRIRESANRLMNWLRDMGPYRPGALTWIGVGVVLGFFLWMGAWFEASLTAAVMLGALVLTFLRRGNGPAVRMSWATSRRLATHDILMDVPLIGVVKDSDDRRGYAWVEYDP
jgi:hypothetical protein